MVEITKIVGEQNARFDEPLSLHSTIGVGGKALAFVTPNNFFDLLRIVRFAQESKLPYKIVGNASNILFDDDDFFGIIICTKNILSYIEIENEHVLVSSGMMLSSLAQKVKEDRLSGLEWSFGIPATVGGALVMNAGAFSCEMKDIVYAVTFFENNKMRTLKKADLKFAYRTSYFKQSNAIIMSAELVLSRDNKKNIEDRMSFYLAKRLEKQPQAKSFGSTFRNPEQPAGYLIEKVGLKGFQIGGAEISAKHANFFVNKGSATARDLIQLIELAKSKVFDEFGISLNEEVEIFKTNK